MNTHSETECKVCSPTHNALIDQIQTMMLKLQDLSDKLKGEKDLVTKLEARHANNYNELLLINEECADHACRAKGLQEDKTKLFESNTTLTNKLSELSSRLAKSERQNRDFSTKIDFLNIQREDLLEKVKDLELSFIKRGQTDQTIHLNKPKEFKSYKSKEGLGADNPYYLKKAIANAPTLYKFEYLNLGPDFQIEFVESQLIPSEITSSPEGDITLSPEQVRKQEDIKRARTDKGQIPYVYANLNESYRWKESKPTHSNDESSTYFNAETQEKQAEFKPYIPSLILEKRIIQLEHEYEVATKAFDLEREVLMSTFKETQSQIPIIPHKLDPLPDCERENLQTEIRRLTSKLAELATNVLQEQTSTSNLQKKYDTLLKGKNALSKPSSTHSEASSCKAFLGDLSIDDQNSFSKNTCSSSNHCETPKVHKGREFSTFLNSDDCHSDDSNLFPFSPFFPSHLDFSPDKAIDEPVIMQKSECSTSTSQQVSVNKPVFQNNYLNRSQKHRYTGTSKARHLYYSSSSDSDFNDASDKRFRRTDVRFKQVWVEKKSKQAIKITKSFNSFSHVKTNNMNHDDFHSSTSAEQSLVLPLKVYSIQQLLQLSHDHICCSACGLNDFVNRKSASDWSGTYHVHKPNLVSPMMISTTRTSNRNRWFGTYSIPQTKANLRGPRIVWVPKSV